MRATASDGRSAVRRGPRARWHAIMHSSPNRIGSIPGGQVHPDAVESQQVRLQEDRSLVANPIKVDKKGCPMNWGKTVSERVKLVVLRALDHAQGSAFANGQHIRQRPTASISGSDGVVRPGGYPGRASTSGSTARRGGGSRRISRS